MSAGDPPITTLLDVADRLDARVAEVGVGALFDELVATMPPSSRRELAALLPRTVEGARDWRVGRMLPHGPGALWVAGQWALDTFPGAIRVAPHPAHERLDVVVERNRERHEAAWLLGGLLGALHADQASLARRILIGVPRRFGARGVRIARLCARGGPHEALVEALEA